MKALLILVAVAGVIAAGVFRIAQTPIVDLGTITGSIARAHAELPVDDPVPAPKSERLGAPLLIAANDTVSSNSPPPLVMAQSGSFQSGSSPSSAIQLPDLPQADRVAQTSLLPITPAAQPQPAQSQPAQTQPANQPMPARQAAAPQPGQVAGQTAPVVDESALRYFAAHGDTARLQAEISRLRALYPTWTPPTDPLAGRTTTDSQLESMWALYAQGRYEEVRQAIAARQAREQGWQPPADLLDRLKLAEARATLTAASNSKDYDNVIRIAADNPSLLTCSEVDVLWRLAEAFARTDKQSRARDAYLYVLNTCDGAAERFATVQKASELLPPAMVDELLAKERTVANGQPEFEPLRDDLARRYIGEANDDPKITVDPKYVTRVEQLAGKGAAPDQLLIAWYDYRHDNLGGAERWFRQAFGKAPEASSAEGLALTLIRQKSPLEAESVLYKWRDTSDETRAAYLAAVANLLAIDPPPVLPDDVLARMAPPVISARNAPAAQQFGWYARAMRQPKTAAEWFAAALAWKPDDESSAYGLALTRFDLGDKAGLAQLQRQWGERSARIMEVGRPATAQRAPLPGTRPPESALVAQPQSPGLVRREMQPASNYEMEPRSAPVRVASAPARPAPARAAAPSTRGCALEDMRTATTPEQSLTRGWCLMDLKRPLEAVQAFQAASTSTSSTVRSDAAYGSSLAYLRVGLTDQASAAAATAHQNNTRAVELQSAILSDRAVNAFKLGRYQEALIALDQRARIVPEQTDLMLLRGYAYMKMGRKPDALRIFEALAAIGNPEGQRAMAAIVWPDNG